MSDILIRGFEMSEPHNCAECPFTDYEDACIFTGVLALNFGRQTNCPLLALLPHGRLIDADANVAIMEKCCKSTDSAYERSFYSFAAQIMRECPTIIEAEECGAEMRKEEVKT